MEASTASTYESASGLEEGAGQALDEEERRHRQQNDQRREEDGAAHLERGLQNDGRALTCRSLPGDAGAAAA